MAHLEKLDKHVADKYFKERIMYTILYLIIWFLVSFVMVALAEPLSNYTFIGFPLHYYMGAQGSILAFIILLFVNAKVSDLIDRKYGIDEEVNKKISHGKVLDH